MSGYKNFFLISLFALFSQNAMAALKPVTFTVKSIAPNCHLLQLIGKTYSPIPTHPIPIGTEVKGKIYPARGDLYMVNFGGNQYLFPAACATLSTVSNNTATNTTVIPTSTAQVHAPAKPKPWMKPWEFRIQIISYQSSVQVTDPLGTFNVRSNVNGLCPGVAYRRALTQRVSFFGESCLILGINDTRGSADSLTQTRKYDNNSSLAFGLRLVPGVDILTLGELVRMGIGVPITYELNNYNVPAGLTISSSSLKLGALLTLQAYRDRYSFLFHYGFVQKLAQAAFGFGLGFEL